MSEPLTKSLKEPAVVLASASPRRRELLSLIGIAHDVRPSGVDETALPDESPVAHAERLARAKAAAAASSAPGNIVIGADTIVVIDDVIIGKPASRKDATQTLRRLSGRMHTVVTAVAVAFNGALVSRVEQVSVTFRALSDMEIAEYVATGEPMDKAGSYGIQGYGATIVQRIEGDYFAVMGLSLVRLVELLQCVGISYRFGRLTPVVALPEGDALEH